MPKLMYITDETALLEGVGKTKTATILKKADPKLLNDKDFMLKAVAINPYAIKYLGESISKDKHGVDYYYDVYYELLAANGMSYCYAPVQIKNEPMAAFAAISNTLEVVPFLSNVAVRHMCEGNNKHSFGDFLGYAINSELIHFNNQYVRSRNAAIFISKYFCRGFEYLAEIGYEDDEEIVRIAVAANSENLAYASERLKNNIDIAKIAFISDSEVFDKEPLKKYKGAIVADREFVKEYLKKALFPVLPSEYEDDDEIALIAVKADGNNYRLLSDRLKNEKTLAKVAVQNDGYCLEYAPDCIKNDWSFIKELIENAADEEIVAIISQSGNDIKQMNEVADILAPILYKNYRHFDNFEVEKDELLLQNVLDKLAEYCDNTTPFSFLLHLPVDSDDNEAIVSTCVGYNAEEIKYASERLLSDRDFILTLMTTLDVDLYDFISDDIKNDKDICDLHKRFELKRKYF